jgi:hypothetical protein
MYTLSRCTGLDVAGRASCFQLERHLRWLAAQHSPKCAIPDDGLDEPSNGDCRKHTRRFAPGRQDMSDRIATQLACGCVSLVHVQLDSGHYVFLTLFTFGNVCAQRA